MTKGRPPEDAHPSGSDAAARAFAELEEKIRASDWSPAKLQEQGMLTKEEADVYQVELNDLLLKPLLGGLSDDVRRRVEAALAPRQASLAPSSRADLLRQLAAIVTWMHHENQADKLNLLKSSLQRLLKRLRERADAENAAGESGRGGGGREEREENNEGEPDHNFSRLLTDILTDPEQKDALIKKLMLPNGRMWIDRRVRGADGTEKTIRIWLSLDLTAEKRAAHTDTEKAALRQTIEDKLRNIPGSLRYRVDDLSSKDSWKAQWERRKGDNASGLPQAIDELKRVCVAHQDVSNAVNTIATRIGLVEEGPARHSFIGLLKHYTTLSGAKMDLWSHVRNAYWHSYRWKDEREATTDLQQHGTPATISPPTAVNARIREWEKLGDAERSILPRKRTTLHYRGEEHPNQEIHERTRVEEGEHKGYWFQVGTSWVREEHLRISFCQHPPLPAPAHRSLGEGGGEGWGEGTFELMAWQVSEDPIEKVTKTSPPPAKRGETAKTFMGDPKDNHGNTTVTAKVPTKGGGRTLELIHQQHNGDCGLICFLNTYAIEHGKLPMSVDQARKLVMKWREEKHERTDAIVRKHGGLPFKDIVRLMSFIHGKEPQQKDYQHISDTETNAQTHIENAIEKLDTYTSGLCSVGANEHAFALKKIDHEHYILIDPISTKDWTVFSKNTLTQELIRRHVQGTSILFIRGARDAGPSWKNPDLAEKEMSDDGARECLRNVRFPPLDLTAERLTPQWLRYNINEKIQLRLPPDGGTTRTGLIGKNAKDPSAYLILRYIDTAGTLRREEISLKELRKVKMG